jgi:hypothetical protein
MSNAPVVSLRSQQQRGPALFRAEKVQSTAIFIRIINTIPNLEFVHEEREKV